MTRPVVQEREDTTRLTNEVRHDTKPEDLLLNTAQLRSSCFIDLFSSRSVSTPDQEPVITDALLFHAIQNHRDIVAGATGGSPLVQGAIEKARKGARRKAKEQAADALEYPEFMSVIQVNLQPSVSETSSSVYEGQFQIDVD
jgi:hypothetical protein